jgi:hypothetical protein
MNGRIGLGGRRGPFVVLVLVAVAVAALLGGRVDRLFGPEPPQLDARGPQGQVWGPAVGFASRARLDEHYRKHGAEFGDITREDYLRRAQALRDAPAGGSVLEAVRGDGVVTRFDRRSGAFIAFGRDGIIRTFFRPNDGERYFRRQVERDH